MDNQALGQDQAPVGMTISSGSGAVLSGFFKGLPVTPGAHAMAMAEVKRRGPRASRNLASLGTRIERFFGFGAIVYAQPVCGGSCHEVQADPQDCGCGQRDFTVYGNSPNLGVLPTPMCTNCGTSDGGYTRTNTLC